MRREDERGPRASQRERRLWPEGMPTLRESAPAGPGKRFVLWVTKHWRWAVVAVCLSSVVWLAWPLLRPTALRGQAVPAPREALDSSAPTRVATSAEALRETELSVLKELRGDLAGVDARLERIEHREHEGLRRARAASLLSLVFLLASVALFLVTVWLVRGIRKEQENGRVFAGPLWRELHSLDGGQKAIKERLDGVRETTEGVHRAVGESEEGNTRRHAEVAALLRQMVAAVKGAQRL